MSLVPRGGKLDYTSMLYKLAITWASLFMKLKSAYSARDDQGLAMDARHMSFRDHRHDSAGCLLGYETLPTEQGGKEGIRVLGAKARLPKLPTTSQATCGLLGLPGQLQMCELR